MLALEELKKKIRSRKFKVGVVGLGYVGLPLSTAFAKAGFCVLGVDVDPQKIRSLKRGRSYVMDVESKDLGPLIRKKLFSISDDYQTLAYADAVIICVPTPLGKTKEPDISHVLDAAKSVAAILKRGQTIILESTTYPGTTDEVMRPLLEKSGLKAEKDFFLAFSPERVDPGNKRFALEEIPKVIGGVGRHSTAAASLIYGTVMQKVVPVSSARAAEMAKLLENTFRSVNIALINEFALVAKRLGIDVWEVIEAAKTKPFGFMPFYPGPGLGGHCLPIDPLYLSWKSRLHGFEAKLIEMAAAVNESMPEHVVERITHLLNQKNIPLKGAKVLLLGVSYKRDVDDTRESPAIDIVDRLAEEDAHVAYSDSFVPLFKASRVKLASSRITPVFLKRQDLAVILADHSNFPYAEIIRHAKLILDTRNVLRPYAKNSHVHFL